MTPSKILFYLCLSFIAGIFINSFVVVAHIIIWAFLLLAVVFILLSFKKNVFLILGFCVLFLMLGVLRHQISEFNISNNELRKFNDKGDVILIGTISGEPDAREKYQKLIIKAEKIILGDKEFNVSGKVLANAEKYPGRKYLDKLKIQGELKKPTADETFNYENYLLKDGIYSVMDFPNIEKDGIGRASSFSYFYSGILWTKQKLRESIRRNYSPPESLILEGTILGDNGAMTQNLKQKLNITGLRHIIAVSGTHIVILSGILMSIFLMLGFRRGQAFYLSISFVWLYLLLVGLPASGIRAGIMGSIYLTAQKLGRQNTSSRTIIMAGGLMLFQNPLLLFYDAGFQLSFLASMGIIYLDPIIRSFLKVLARNKFDNLTGIASTTFSAQIFTMPLMVFNFGNISLVSLITNLLILPIVSPLMIFGFISVFLGAVFNLLGWILSFPCHILLLYFVKVIDFFSQSWAIKTFQNVPFIWLVISYLIIGFTTRLLNRKYSQKFL